MNLHPFVKASLWLAAILGLTVLATPFLWGRSFNAPAEPQRPTGDQSFSDVQSSDWFYSYVMSLYTIGVISGYQDGTFRPNAPITRGQFTKVLVLATGLQGHPPNNATFADVPAGSPFFDYIETAAALGMAGGYDCGGRGEPCDSQHRPYFRSGSDVNRGQAAKMLTTAVGINPHFPDLPMFADVLPSNPFYGYVNAAALQGLIAGYECNSAIENCASNLLAFHPFQNATRAQASKIIDLSRPRRYRTPSPAPSRTASPTSRAVSQSPTAGAQSTPVPPWTATNTRTQTPPNATSTSTNTAVFTPSNTPTTQASFTPGPTQSAVASATGTSAASNTPTRTNPSFTPSRTPTVRPTNSATGTATRTSTPPPAGTTSRTATPTWTRISGGSGITANDPISCSMWPSDNIWNRRVDALPTLAASNAYVASIGSGDYVSNGFASRMWEGSSIGNPYNVVPTAQPMVDMTFTDYPENSDPGPYPYPTYAIIQGASYLTPVPPSGDRHVSIVREGSCTLYETWHSHPSSDGSWTAANGAVFNLLSNQLRPDGWTSADAAGFAILPGLIRYDEVASGQVTHAIRFTAPGSAIRNTYVWPARHTDGQSGSSSTAPMGTRFRLKASVDISGYPPMLRTILQGLKTYGMFLSDTGDPWQIDGAPDQRWDDNQLQLLHGILGSDFEAVDESGLMIDPNSGRSR